MEKVFVKVRCSHLPDGTIRPESLEWEDGQACMSRLRQTMNLKEFATRY